MIIAVEVDIIHLITVRMIMNFTDVVNVINDTTIPITCCLLHGKGQGHWLGKAMPRPAPSP